MKALKNMVFFILAVWMILLSPFGAIAATGDIDLTFNALNGYALYNGTASASDIGYGVAVQADGKIVLVGRTNGSGTGSDVLVLRYNSNGTLDTTFNNTGIVTYSSGAAKTVSL